MAHLAFMFFIAHFYNFSIFLLVLKNPSSCWKKKQRLHQWQRSLPEAQEQKNKKMWEQQGRETRLAAREARAVRRKSGRT